MTLIRIAWLAGFAALLAACADFEVPRSGEHVATVQIPRVG